MPHRHNPRTGSRKQNMFVSIAGNFHLDSSPDVQRDLVGEHGTITQSMWKGNLDNCLGVGYRRNWSHSDFKMANLGGVLEN